jgi:tetratricopeptide (TPR) repeat protein
MKGTSLVRVVLAVSLMLPFGLSAAPPAARACGNAVNEVVDTGAINIAAAEKALSEGRFAAAVVGVSKAFPAIKTVAVGKKPLSDRGLRILALAAIRTDGALNVAKVMQGTTAEEKAENVQFAIDTLRKLNARRANNPSFQTDLGEALAKVPRFKAEAFKLLNDLAQKDLVASPEGYATLAKLRENLGDKEGAVAAVKRCTGMTKSPKMCEVASSDASSRS